MMTDSSDLAGDPTRHQRVDDGTTLDQVLALHPSARAVLDAFGVDPWGDSGRSLAVAARDDDVDLDTLRSAIRWLLVAERGH